MSRLAFEPQALQCSHVVRPTRLYLHPEFKHHFTVKGFFHVAPGFCSNRAEPRSAGSNNNALLTVSLHKYDGTDVLRAALIWLKTLNLDRRCVWQLVTQLAYYFFTYELRRKKSLRSIGDLSLWK